MIDTEADLNFANVPIMSEQNFENSNGNIVSKFVGSGKWGLCCRKGVPCRLLPKCCDWSLNC